MIKLEVNTSWIDINDEKPDFNKHVLVWPVENESMHVMYFVAQPNKFKYDCGNTEYWAVDTVTHWRELPEGPLRDCPFCGSEDLYFHIDEVGCQHCSATAISRAKWNMRK